MTKNEYLDNQKVAMLSKSVQLLKMKDMLAPDGKPLPSDEKVVLNAVPYVDIPIDD